MASRKEELQELLEPFGQECVLAFWDELNAHEREHLAAQIRALDLKLIDRLVRETSSAEDWAALARRAGAPPAFRLDDRSRTISPEQAHERGQQALAAGHVGVILVAGGQGTRLGFEHPKGMFAIGPVSGDSLFQILLEKIAARARVAGMRIPLYLMTSPATHDETVEYLRANENFGLPQEDLKVFCQGTMPAVDATTGRLLLAEQASTGAQSRRARRHVAGDGRHAAVWPTFARRGLRQLFYCQIDNPLVEMCDPEIPGLSPAVEFGAVDASGGQANVARQGGQRRVDRRQAADHRVQRLESAGRRDRRAPRGRWRSDLLGRQHGDPRVRRRRFSSAWRESGTALPFHVAKKAVPHVDASGRAIEPKEPNAIKFERFIFDLLPEARAAIVVEVDETQAFAPVKNAPGDARDTPESVQAADDRFARRLAARGGLRGGGRHARRNQPAVCPKCPGSGRPACGRDWS